MSLLWQNPSGYLFGNAAKQLGTDFDQKFVLKMADLFL
jgi:hypothetical protein